MPPRIAIVLLLAAIASSGHAHAATEIGQVLSIPPSTDIWRHMLEIIFPGVGPLAGNPTQGTSALAAASSSFVAVLMAVGTAVLCWHTVSGLVATAHEGTVLGRQWHQVWAPVRVVMGVGLLAPVVKGFCLAQVLVLTLACWSGSFGNVLWSSYLDGLTSTSLSAPSLPATGAVVRAFADAEICYAALNKNRADVGLSSLPDVHESQSNLSTLGGVGVTAGNAWNYLTSWVSGGSEASTAQSNRTLVSWDYGSCGSVSVPLALNAGGDSLVTGFDKSRLTAFENLRGAMENSSAAFVGSMTGGPGDATSSATASAAAVSAIGNAKSSFDKELSAASSALVGSDNGGALSSFQQNAKSAGWVSAGVYYPTISRLQTRVQQIADTMPALTVNRAADDDSRGAAEYLREMRSAPDGIIFQFDAAYDKAAVGWSGGAVPDLSSGVKAGADGSSAASVAGVLSWLFRNVFSAVDGYVSGVSANVDAGSPLQQMTDFGSKLLSAATAVLLIGIPALYAAVGTLAMFAGATGLLGYVITLAAAIGGLILAVGVSHAYVLPLIPFVQWVFAVVSMLVLVCEAMIAAPLWALMHMRMDGPELVGQHQSAGYLILFNLLLRIPLVLFGLFLSLSIFQAGIWLLSATFYPAMLSATADTSAGLVGAVVMLILIGYLHWQLALRSFNLITALPDRVSRWFGAAPEAAGEDRQTSDVRGLLIHSSQSAARGAVPRSGQRPAGGPMPTPGPAGTVESVGHGGGAVVSVAGAEAVTGAEAIVGQVDAHERSD